MSLCLNGITSNRKCHFNNRANAQYFHGKEIEAANQWHWLSLPPNTICAHLCFQPYFSITISFTSSLYLLISTLSLFFFPSPLSGSCVSGNTGMCHASRHCSDRTFTVTASFMWDRSIVLLGDYCHSDLPYVKEGSFYCLHFIIFLLSVALYLSHQSVILWLSCHSRSLGSYRRVSGTPSSLLISNPKAHPAWLP